MLVDVVLQVLEMLYAGFFDGNLTYGYTQLLHKVHGIGIGAVCGSEARHCDAHNVLAVHPKHVESADANQQSQRAVESSADAHHGGLGTCVLHSLGQTCCLNAEDFFAALAEVLSFGYERTWCDGA